MKHIITLIVLAVFISGCSTNQVNNTNYEKNMTKERAEQLALDKVYELTKNKEVYEDKKPWARDSWQENNKWVVIVWASHTIIEVNVYNETSVKILQKVSSVKK